MDINDRFATRANGVEETPEPFRRALFERLSPRDRIHLLAFKPARTIPDARSPATLLTVTDRRWLLVSADEDERASVVECAFDDTLLVELTEILLHGQLKIDFVAGGTARACVVEFNTVSDQLCREAVRHILRGLEGRGAASPSDRPAESPSIEMTRIVFRNAVPKILAEGRPPVAGVQWPAIYGWYARELAPASALITTESELVLVSEKRVGIRMPGRAKYGYSATYLPLARLAGFGFRRNERFSILDLEMHASHGGETLHVLFPPQREQEVRQVLDRAVRQSAQSFSKLGVS